MAKYDDPRTQYAHAALYKSYMGYDFGVPAEGDQHLRPAQQGGTVWLMPVDSGVATAQLAGAVPGKIHVMAVFNGKALAAAAAATAAIKITDRAGTEYDVAATLDVTTINEAASADMAEIPHPSKVEITLTGPDADQLTEIGLVVRPARHEWK